MMAVAKVASLIYQMSIMSSAQAHFIIISDVSIPCQSKMFFYFVFE